MSVIMLHPIHDTVIYYLNEQVGGCLPMLNGIAFGNDFKNSNHRTLANMMSANVCPTVTDGISSRSATTWNSTEAEKSMWTGCPAWHNKDDSTKIKFLKPCYLFKHLLHARVNRHLSKFAHWHVLNFAHWHVLNVFKPQRRTVFTPHSF